jgi:hypothetical protein
MAVMIKPKEAYDIQAIQKAGGKLYYPTSAEVQRFIQATKKACAEDDEAEGGREVIGKYFKAVAEAEKKLRVK